MEKKIKYYFLVSFIISSLIFLSGFGLGFFLNFLKLENLEPQLYDLKSDIYDFELSNKIIQLFGDDLRCDYIDSYFKKNQEDSLKLGYEINLIEESNEFSNEYINQKKEYMRMIISNWINFKLIKEYCNNSNSIILYFYNNINCSDCESQGYLLDNLYENNKNISIFSLDTGIGQKTVNMMVELYDINIFPSVVINEKVYSGIVSYNELKEILGI